VEWSTLRGIAPIEKLPTVIGSGVYIGLNSVIQVGVKIGDNAVIGAMSFVNRYIADGEKYYGVASRTTNKQLK